MDPFNALPTAAAARKIPPLREAPPTMVMLCSLVALTDIERALDAAREVPGGAGVPLAKREVPGGAGVPLAKMADQPWFVVIPSPPPCDDSALRFPLCTRPWNTPGSCSFPSSNDRKGAPIGHAYTSHYGGPHSEEGDRPASTCGPFE
jgi:hypothetical protein